MVASAVLFVVSKVAETDVEETGLGFLGKMQVSRRISLLLQKMGADKRREPCSRPSFGSPKGPSMSEQPFALASSPVVGGRGGGDSLQLPLVIWYL